MLKELPHIENDVDQRYNHWVNRGVGLKRMLVKAILDQQHVNWNYVNVVYLEFPKRGKLPQELSDHSPKECKIEHKDV
jgi:hypothetical protein